MKITVERLGRLQEATFDLSKDLLVFVGPNNTSKTYAAYLIYGLFSQYIPPTAKMTRDAMYASSLFGLSEKAESDRVPLDFFIDHFAQGTLDALMEASGNDLVKDLFAAGPELFGETRVRIALEDDGIAYLREHVERKGFVTRHGVVGVSKAPGSLEVVGLDPEVARSSDDVRAVLLELVMWVLTNGFRKAAILPAERSAIQLFSRELLLNRSEVLERLWRISRRDPFHEPTWRSKDPRSMADLLRTSPRYPLPIRDTLKITGDLAALRSRKAPFAELADLIEQQVLQGAVHVSDEGQLSYVPEGSNTALDIHLASSSVKSLSLLTFYLRHVIDEGDLLIMDEPELNLHPDNQRRVARLLARLVRAGVQVIISTHSDYVIRELNNLIMLSQDQDGALREELGYAEEETLRSEQVGVYLFGPTQANALPVDPTGFSVETIDLEINRLNTTAEKIYLSLFGRAGR